MDLNDFSGKWGVMTSGRPEKIPMGNGHFLRIDTTGGPTAWTLQTQIENGEPVQLGKEQTDKGHQDGGADGVHRIYCTVTFEEGSSFFFEAVLARNQWKENLVLYGHLYPHSFANPIGEGGVGAWSADRQGTFR